MDSPISGMGSIFICIKYGIYGFIKYSIKPKHIRRKKQIRSTIFMSLKVFSSIISVLVLHIW